MRKYKQFDCVALNECADCVSVEIKVAGLGLANRKITKYSRTMNHRDNLPNRLSGHKFQSKK